MRGQVNLLDVLADEASLAAESVPEAVQLQVGGKSTEDTHDGRQNSREKTVGDDEMAVAVNEETAEAAEDTTSKCGALGCYPHCLQRFTDHRYFVACFCVKNILQSLVYTYLVGIQSSVERHFHFSSWQFGLLPSIGQVGPVVTAAALSCWASGSCGSNRPRCMALGHVIMAAGLCCGLLSYALFAPPLAHNRQQFSRQVCTETVASGVHKPVSWRNASSNLVNDNGRSLGRSKLSATDHILSDEWDYEAVAAEEPEYDTCTIDSDMGYRAYFLWALQYVLLSSGSTVVFITSASYLDDNVSPTNSPLFFALGQSSRIFGPIGGFFLASVCLKYYVHPGVDPGITYLDARWIGAWWLGQIVIVLLLLLFAWLVSLFPQQLQHRQLQLSQSTAAAGGHVPNPTGVPGDGTGSDSQRRGQRSVISSNATYSCSSNDSGGGGSCRVQLEFSPVDVDGKPALRDWSRRLGSLVCHNRLLMLNNLAAFAYFAGVIGFYTYLPKYMEHVYRIDKSAAANYSSVSKSLIVVGVLGSGVLMRRYRPTASTVALSVALLRTVGTLPFVALLALHCRQVSSDLPGIRSLSGDSLVLDISCNADCRCSTEQYVPVCYRAPNTEIITTSTTSSSNNSSVYQSYFSPCHAGCGTTLQNNSNSSSTPSGPHNGSLSHPINHQPRYTDCKCISQNPEAVLTSGLCNSACDRHLVVFLVLTSLSSVAHWAASIPHFMLILRSVPAGETAVALSVTGAVMALALMVGSLSYSALVDSACLVWERSCQQRGACWIYDVDRLRYCMLGFLLVFLALSSLAQLSVYTRAHTLSMYGDDGREQSTVVDNRHPQTQQENRREQQRHTTLTDNIR